MPQPEPGVAGSRPKWPAQRIRRLVARSPEAPRPVAWWALVESVYARGFAVAAVLVAVVVVAAAEVTGLVPLDVALPASAVVVGAALVVDTARLVRWWRIARHGVLVTATVTDDASEPARAGQRRLRHVPHPLGQAVRDRTRVPRDAPEDAFAQSVLVAPDRPEVWLTLTVRQPLREPPPRTGPAGGELAETAPLIAVTGWGRLAAAWRAGIGPLVVGLVAASLVAPAAGQAGWLLVGVGPAVGAVAAWRVRVRVDGHGVRVRSSLWTRTRPWARLDRLAVGEVVLFASRWGSTVTASMLTFHDDLGVRLAAVATVRCWDRPWLSELVRRCERAGVAVDDAVRPR